MWKMSVMNCHIIYHEIQYDIMNYNFTQAVFGKLEYSRESRTLEKLLIGEKKNDSYSIRK